jgi:hypothetical protein
MKKNTKSAKSPAPATKSVTRAAASKAAAKPVAAGKTAAAVKPVARAKAAKLAPAKVPVPSVVKSVALKPVVTVITAKIDIGFGNALYIRGEGAGLSWDHGLVLACVADDEWSVTLAESSRPIIFKFLVNDLSWSAGEDYVVAAGSSTTFKPAF